MRAPPPAGRTSGKWGCAACRARLARLLLQQPEHGTLLRQMCQKYISPHLRELSPERKERLVLALLGTMCLLVLLILLR